VEIPTQNLYNRTPNYKLLTIPALMVMRQTMMRGGLPALNVVGEKEAGTIEQINVTPVGKVTVIAAKLIPYWMIGYVTVDNVFPSGMVTLRHSAGGTFPHYVRHSAVLLPL
jgi:ABC-type Na+ efflux pump, permease component